jgi:hypothetical protein
VFPATTLQTCIVHLIRNSLDYASWKDRKLLAAALRPVYTAASTEAAEQALNDFERGAWGQRYPTVTAAWRRAWDRVIPFFAFPPEVRRVVRPEQELRRHHEERDRRQEHSVGIGRYGRRSVPRRTITCHLGGCSLERRKLTLTSTAIPPKVSLLALPRTHTGGHKTT